MFSYKIILSNGAEFDYSIFAARTGDATEDTHTRTVTPTEHFCTCVHATIDLLNGGEEYNSKRASRGKSPLTPSFNTRNAPFGFLIALYKHPAFFNDAEVLKILSLDPLVLSLDATKTSHPNYAQYEELYRIYQLHKDNPDNKTIPTRLAHVLVDFEAPGIQEIRIGILASSQQERLRNISFPAELIPEKFRHQLSLAAGDPAEDKELKTKIALFADKAEALYNLDDSTAPGTPTPYKKFLAFLLDNNPVKMLEAIVQLTALETGTAASASAGTTFFGSAKDAHKAVIRNHLFKKYGLPKNDDSVTLEKLLRCAATNANVSDVQVLLELLKVNPSAQDANPSSKKSALHWAVIRAQDHKDEPELFDRYKKCIMVLKRSGADLELIDAHGKAARDYDSNNLFSKKLRTASGATASASASTSRT